MSDEADRDASPRRGKPDLINVTIPDAARVADFLIGGRHNFAADREAGRVAAASAPAIERIPAEVRCFRRRVITYLVATGVRQFLEVGLSPTTLGGTHQIAQKLDPRCRVLYTVGDAMLLARAQAQLRSDPGGAVSCVQGNIADVDAIIARASPTLDLSLPVAVLLSTLWHVPTTIAAARAVASLLAPLPSGSYVVIYHLASDLDPDMPAATRLWNKTVPAPATLRAHADVAAMVNGLELVEPGVVPISEWRPGAGEPAKAVPLHAVVARKR